MNTTIKTAAQKIEMDGVVFNVRGESYQDFLFAISEVGKTGLTHEKDGGVHSVALNNLSIIPRIVSWEGPKNEDGTAAECSTENKLAFFGQNPVVLNELSKRLSAARSEAEKN